MGPLPYAETLSRLDEIEPRSERAKHLSDDQFAHLHPDLIAKLHDALVSPEVQAAIRLPLPHDCEQTSVSVALWNPDRTACVSFPCVVAHDGATVVHISFVEGWRYLVRTMDRDPDDSETQDLICELAKRAFAARPR